MPIIARSLLVCLCGLFVTAAAVAAPGDPDIGTKKFGASNDVKMDIVAPGNLQPMNAEVRQEKNAVVLVIVEGGTTPAKAVEVDHGTCKQLGSAQYRLPPFRGGQYQAILKGADLTKLQDGQHSIVVVGSSGKRRSTYACGELDKPNLFRH
jgi:hypothetical protein